jgi:hypothetical protein
MKTTVVNHPPTELDIQPPRCRVAALPPVDIELLHRKLLARRACLSSLGGVVR